MFATLRTERALRTSRRHEASGDFRAAVDHLTAANRQHPNPTLEHELVQLRHREFFRRAAASSSEGSAITWPPAFTDQFSIDLGIPEISAADLTVDAIRSGVLGHGAVIVRGLLNAADVATLRDATDRCYDAQDQWYASPENPQPTEWYHEFRSDINDTTAEMSRFGRSWHRQGSAVLAADTPRGLFTYLEIMQRNGIPDLVRQYLGETPSISVEKTVFRRVPPDTLGGWHQDGAFLGDGIHSLNLWIAITDCGAEAPTMEFVGKRLDHIVETGTEDAPYSWAVGDAVARRVAGPGGVVRPHYTAGDAIFFDQMNLHTTSGGPTMTKTRYAIESWWFSPSHYPMTTLPLMV